MHVDVLVSVQALLSVLQLHDHACSGQGLALFSGHTGVC